MCRDNVYIYTILNPKLATRNGVDLIKQATFLGPNLRCVVVSVGEAVCALTL